MIHSFHRSADLLHSLIRQVRRKIPVKLGFLPKNNKLLKINKLIFSFILENIIQLKEKCIKNRHFIYLYIPFDLKNGTFIYYLLT